MLAILVIYLVLGILYESFIHPLTILSGLPFAGFGALLTLLLFRMELSIYAFVGIIMLIGLVKKNAIMMIDFALEAERNDGKTPRDAILEACQRAVPADHDDHHGGADGHAADRARASARAPSRAGRWASRWWAGSRSRRSSRCTSRPVIYTYLDALQQRFGRGAHAKERERVGELAPEAARARTGCSKGDRRVRTSSSSRAQRGTYSPVFDIREAGPSLRSG